MDRDEVQAMIDQALKVHVYEQHRARGNTFQPPTLDEVKQYAKEKGLPLDCVKFFEFYAKKGWMVGKSKMKDWHLAAQASIREGWCKLVGAAPTAKVKILCACGCGRESFLEIDGKRWALWACYGRWLKDLQARSAPMEPKPVKRLGESMLKTNGQAVMADFKNDAELRGGL